MDAAELLGAALAQGGQRARDTVSLQVADVTDTGTVNLVLPDGELLLDVPCAVGYRDRQAGDWVAVRLSARPVVLWKVGEDPAQTEAEQVQTIAEEAALDAQQVRAATYGTGAPTGTGWQQASAVYVRKVSDRLELHFVVPSVDDPSPEAPPTRAPKSVSISPTDSGSWRNGRPDSYADYPMQGDWTGGGDRRGGWFYGTAIADACAGKTVSAMTVSFTRRRGSGYNSKRPLHLYLHSYTSPPSGQLSLGEGPEDLLRLSVGGTGTATLPAAWRTALAAGTARGLAIYARGSADYMAVSGGRLTISFSS